MLNKKKRGKKTKRKALALVRGRGELALKSPSPSSGTLKSVPCERQPGNVGWKAEKVRVGSVAGGGRPDGKR